MPISTNGTIITRVAGALYGEYLSNASYNELALVSTIAPATVAANFITSDFMGRTDAQIATTVLSNLGLSSVAGLNNWVAAQLTAAGSTAAAKGAKLVDMLNSFSAMTADATYGSFATTFNNNVNAALTYSQTAGAAGGSFTTAAATAAAAAKAAADAAAAAAKATADAAAAKAAADKVAADKVVADKAAADKAAADKVIADAAAAKVIADKAAADKVIADAAAAKVIADAAAAAAVAPQKFTLTTGVDTGADFTGKDGADTYTATTTSTNLQTLTAGDNLSGGLGADTLNITNTVANTTLGAGVIASSIETVNVTATGTTTVDASGFAGVTSVGTVGSTENVTFTGLKDSIPAINVTGTNKDLTVTLAGALTAGITDSATINLNGAASTANNTVTVNGIENLTVNATGSSGSLDANGNIQSQTTVVSDSLKSLTLAGAGAAKVKATLSGAGVGTTAAAATVTGTTGSDDLEFSVPAAGKVTATMGAGDDTVRVSTLAATTTIAGGEGTDTLVYSGTATVAAAAVANVTGFEKVVISGPASVALATSDLTYTVAASGTYTGLAASGTVNLQAGGTVTLANTALTGATDAVTFNVGKSGSLGTAATGATIAAGEFDVVTVNASAKSSTLATETAAYSVSGTTLNKVTLSAPHGATLSGGGAALTTIDASGVQGAFSSTATTSSTAALTITGGSGNDAINGGTKADSLVGGAGDDTITGGVGQDTLTGGTGNDVFAFGLNNADTVVSGSVAMDTITDFESGKDRIQLSQQNDKFVGNAANIQLGLAAMTANNQSFYVTSENTLYVVATKGTLAQNDTIIKLSASVTSLKEADVGTGVQTGGADITLTSVAGTSLSNVTLTASTLSSVTALYTANTSLSTTGFNDTVRVNSTQLDAVGGAYATLTGGNGSDTLAIYAGNAAGQTTALELSLVTGFETISLNETSVTGGTTTAFDIVLDDANVPTGQTTTVTAAGVSTVAVSIVASAVTDSATSALNITGGSFATGSGDTLTGGTGNDTINGGAGNDVITGGSGADSLLGSTGDDTVVAAGQDTIDGGAGNDVVQIAGALGASSTELASIELGAGVNRIQFTNTNGTAANATIVATGGVYDIVVDDGVLTATMTPSQFSGAFSVTGVDGAVDADPEGITFSTSGTVNVTAATIEHFALSAGTSGTASNTITAGANQTSITGAAGNDTLNVASDTAAASLLAGAVKLGNGTADTINVTGNTGTGTITLSANVTGVETIAFANTSTDVTLVTNDANAGTLLTVTMPSAATGKLSFNGAAELDATSAYSVVGATGADTIIGGAGNDTITGNNGVNNLAGGAGADTITSGTGIDYIAGDNNGAKRVETYTVTTTGAGIATITLGMGGETIAAAYATSGDVTIAALQTALAADARYGTFFTSAVTVVTTNTTDDVLTITYLMDGTNVGSVTTSTNTLAVNTTGTNSTAVAGTQITAGTAGATGADSVNAGSAADVILSRGADSLTGGAGADKFGFMKAGSVLGAMTTITDYRAATGDNAGALDTIIIGDVIAAAGTTATVQDLSTSASLGAALNAAANTNAQNAGLSVFMWGGDTYAFVETTGATTTFVTTDFLVKITGTPFTTATAIAGLGLDGV